MSYRIRDILFIRFDFQELVLVHFLSIYLRLVDDLCHGLHSLYREHPRSAFPRKHHSRRPVEHRICHICYLRYRLEHLRCRYYRLACPAAFLDEFLLYTGQLFKIDFHAHVAASHHYPIGQLQDLCKVRYAFGIFYLRNDLYLFPAVVIEQLPERAYVIAASNERRRHVVHVHLDTEHYVASVRFTDVFEIERFIRYIDAFSVADFPAGDHSADDVCIRSVRHFHSDTAVIDQYDRPGFHLCRQRLVGGVCALCGPNAFFRRENECVTRLQHLAAVFKIADSYFRSLCIEKYRSRHSEFVSYFPEGFDGLSVALMRSMRKIQPRHIHARFQHCLHCFFILARRSQSTYDLSLFKHKIHLPFLPVYI